MFNKVLLCDSCKLWTFITISKILLFLLVQALLFLLMEVLTSLLLCHLVHSIFHYLVIIVVAICGHISSVLVSKLEMGSLEILFCKGLSSI